MKGPMKQERRWQIGSNKGCMKRKNEVEDEYSKRVKWLTEVLIKIDRLMRQIRENRG